MRLDAYTHYIPSKFLERMNKVAGDHKDIGKRMRGIPAIYDLDVRKKVIDQFRDKDYAQIISYAMPPIEHFAKGDEILEYLKLDQRRLRRALREGSDLFPRLDCAGLARHSETRRSRKPNAR